MMRTTDRLVNARRVQTRHMAATCDDDGMQKDPPSPNMAPDKPPPKGPCCGSFRAALQDARAKRDTKRSEDLRQARGAHDPRRDNPRT